jgi:hypothetical protein
VRAPEYYVSHRAKMRELWSLLREIAGSAVESDTARNYVVVQIDRDTWNELDEFR